MNNLSFNSRYEKGFTLIEMSIVLVIIGLIVSGIVSGQSLVRSAELRSVVTDINQYKTALKAFDLQYSQLPGDMRNAGAYWAASANPACTNAVVPAGCNGDDDGLIEAVAGGGEWLRAWQHLSLSGIISGNYSGIDQGVAPLHALEINIPPSEVKGSGYMLIFGTSGAEWGARNGNHIIFASVAGATAAFDNSALKVTESESLDKKTDDGLAGSGEIMAFEGADAVAGACITAASDPASYNLAGTTKACTLWFWVD